MAGRGVWWRDLWAAATRVSGRSEARIVGSSGLLDVSVYLIEGWDVHAAGVDPFEHFCTYGWREGRRPNLYFDPLWYADVYLSSRPDDNPLVHYIRRGEAAGCRPICFFDPVWYRKTYRLGRHASPLRHFLAHRRSQRFAPNGQFDLAFYLDRHGREIGVNRDPFAHFLRHAAERDLDPSASFASAAYRASAMATGATGRGVVAANAAAAGLAARERRIPFIHALDSSARATASQQPRPSR